MHTRLRITLLAISLAIGAAVAFALAVRPAPTAGKTPVTAARRFSIKQVPIEAPPPSTPEPPPPIPDSRRPAPELTPVVAPYRDPIARQVGQLEDTIQQLEESSQRRERSMLRAIANLQTQLDTQPAPAAVATPPAPTPAAPPAPAAPAVPSEELPSNDVHRGEGDDKLVINVQNSDIRQVLERLSQEAGLNIVASKNVTGPVNASLSGVDVETALAVILKSTGLVASREGNIIYVGLPSDLAQMNQTQDRIITKVYRPNYIRAADLQSLFVPMLTPQIGKATVSAPQEVDVPSDKTKVGGNSFAGTDVVVVRDYAAVIADMDQIFEEVDIKPRQVAIEAMILSVKLNDSYKFGVDLHALKDTNNAALITGTPLTNLGNFKLDSGGLQFGFTDASLGLFIECLEKVGDTNVIAAPRLTCLNKQRAEIQIGEELGYVSTTVTETSATQTVNFLDVGTLLRIRPNISNDGLIRLEVHPELSTGNVTIEQGLSLPQKAVTQVTTNVLCPDGCTVVIGGLIREDLTNTRTQIPYLGALPWVGVLFRDTDQKLERNEIIVLITPRIVSEPFMCKEGTQYGNDFTQRQSMAFDKMSPIGKRNVGLHHLRMARAAYNAGDYDIALKQINLALHYDVNNRAAVALRNDIIGAGGYQDETIHQYLHYGLNPFTGRHIDYSRQGFWWKEFEGFGPPEVTSTPDHGWGGPTRTIVRPTPPTGIQEAPPTIALPGFEAIPAPATTAPPPAGSPPPSARRSPRTHATTPTAHLPNSTRPASIPGPSDADQPQSAAGGAY
jgi:type IV pilus assembly protein PilQ